MNTEPKNQNHAMWGFTGTLIWGLIIALAFMIIQTGVMILFISAEYADSITADNAESLMNELQYNGLLISLATIATMIGCSLILLGAINLKKESSIKHYLGLNLVSFENVKYWLFFIIVCICISELLTYTLGKPLVPDFIKTVYSSTESRWLLWFALVIAAPVFEELFFRGFILSGLSATFMGPVAAIVLTSIAWAGIHIQYELYLIFTIFIFGLVLGAARLKTNSVLLTIGLHSFMNLVSMIETSILIP